VSASFTAQVLAAVEAAKASPEFKQHQIKALKGQIQELEQRLERDMQMQGWTFQMDRVALELAQNKLKTLMEN
jgi:hypothetical protein